MAKAGRETERGEVDYAAITDETTMPLDLAATVAVARGVLASATGRCLRRAAERDTLVTYKLLGRRQTTLGDIKRMVKRCRVQPKVSDSTMPERMIAGSSETPDSRMSARDAALASVRKLKESSRNTSPPVTGRISGKVIPLTSSSRTS